MLQNLLACAAASLAATFALPCLATDGDPDATFGSAGISYVATDDVSARSIYPRVTIELPDGKLLFAGARNKVVPPAPFYEPQIRGALVRLNADGSPDAAFGNTAIPGLFELPDLVSGTRMQGIESMALLDDGSLIAVGTGMVNAPAQGFIVKFDADGTLDAAYGDAGTVLLPAFQPHAVAIDSEGRALVGGETFDPQAFIYTSTVIRLDASGVPDPEFGDAGTVTIDWGDAQLSGYVSDIKVGSAGDVAVGGGYEVYGAGLGSDFAIARLTADGSFDTGFAGTGWTVFHDPAESSTINRVNKLAVSLDGRIAFAGYHSAGENITGLVLGRLGVDGAIDQGFGDASTPGFLAPQVLPTAQNVNVSGLLMQDDGKLLVSAGYFTWPDRQGFFALRATAEGQLDPDFADAGVFQADLAPEGSYSESSAMALQPDGRIVLAGRSMRSTESPIVELAAVRLLNSAGPDDRIFGDGFDLPAP
jgi:uncharacterized delta-60 repeat protein